MVLLLHGIRMAWHTQISTRLHTVCMCRLYRWVNECCRFYFVCATFFCCFGRSLVHRSTEKYALTAHCGATDWWWGHSAVFVVRSAYVCESFPRPVTCHLVGFQVVSRWKTNFFFIETVMLHACTTLCTTHRHAQCTFMYLHTCNADDVVNTATTIIEYV